MSFLLYENCPCCLAGCPFCNDCTPSRLKAIFEDVVFCPCSLQAGCGGIPPEWNWTDPPGIPGVNSRNYFAEYLPVWKSSNFNGTEFWLTRCKGDEAEISGGETCVWEYHGQGATVLCDVWGPQNMTDFPANYCHHKYQEDLQGTIHIAAQKLGGNDAAPAETYGGRWSVECYFSLDAGSRGIGEVWDKVFFNMPCVGVHDPPNYYCSDECAKESVPIAILANQMGYFGNCETGGNLGCGAVKYCQDFTRKYCTFPHCDRYGGIGNVDGDGMINCDDKDYRNPGDSTYPGPCPNAKGLCRESKLGEITMPLDCTGPCDDDPTGGFMWYQDGQQQWHFDEDRKPPACGWTVGYDGKVSLYGYADDC